MAVPTLSPVCSEFDPLVVGLGGRVFRRIYIWSQSGDGLRPLTIRVVTLMSNMQKTKMPILELCRQYVKVIQT